ncbi:hypothetical protein DFH09DRAFT_1111214 [Mycena vulgaris]|nr:hypothetical protein DFH09DRAFT_1111214 [Mycena vulgaris]
MWLQSPQPEFKAQASVVEELEQLAWETDKDSGSNEEYLGYSSDSSDLTDYEMDQDEMDTDKSDDDKGADQMDCDSESTRAEKLLFHLTSTHDQAAFDAFCQTVPDKYQAALWKTTFWELLVTVPGWFPITIRHNNRCWPQMVEGQGGQSEKIESEKGGGDKRLEGSTGKESACRIVEYIADRYQSSASLGQSDDPTPVHPYAREKEQNTWTLAGIEPTPASPKSMLHNFVRPISYQLLEELMSGMVDDLLHDVVRAVCKEVTGLMPKCRVDGVQSALHRLARRAVVNRGRRGIWVVIMVRLVGEVIEEEREQDWELLGLCVVRQALYVLEGINKDNWAELQGVQSCRGGTFVIYRLVERDEAIARRDLRLKFVAPEVVAILVLVYHLLVVLSRVSAWKKLLFSPVMFEDGDGVERAYMLVCSEPGGKKEAVTLVMCRNFVCKQGLCLLFEESAQAFNLEATETRRRPHRRLCWLVRSTFSVAAIVAVAAIVTAAAGWGQVYDKLNGLGCVGRGHAKIACIGAGAIESEGEVLVELFKEGEDTRATLRERDLRGCEEDVWSGFNAVSGYANRNHGREDFLQEMVPGNPIVAWPRSKGDPSCGAVLTIGGRRYNKGQRVDGTWCIAQEIPRRIRGLQMAGGMAKSQRMLTEVSLCSGEDQEIDIPDEVTGSMEEEGERTGLGWGRGSPAAEVVRAN